MDNKAMQQMELVFSPVQDQSIQGIKSPYIIPQSKQAEREALYHL